MAATEHVFQAVAYVENVPLKELAATFESGRRAGYELAIPLPTGGTAFMYPFGAVVFYLAPRPPDGPRCWSACGRSGLASPRR